jgi:glycosyltransferase involved in cell wall biosynthesis
MEYVGNLILLLGRWLSAPPDILHVQFLPLATVGNRLEMNWLRLVKLLGIRIVYTVHNLLPQDTECQFEGVYSQLYPLADRLICHDSSAARELERRFGVSRAKISVIPHGVLFQEAAPSGAAAIRQRWGVAADECLVMWQGIIRAYKGLSCLLRAWRRVAAGGPRAKLAIVGTGEPSLLSALSREVEELGVRDSVRLELRFVSTQEMANLNDAADVLTYPYNEATTSGALMTGIARRKAIVATRLPAFEQVLRDGYNALLVSPGDEEQLASALSRLIDDPALRRDLGARLSEAAFPDWNHIARMTCDCYRLALAENETHDSEPVQVNS